MHNRMRLSCLFAAGLLGLLATESQAQFVGGAIVGGPPVVVGGPFVPVTPMVASPVFPVTGGYTVIAPRPGIGFVPYGVGVRRMAPAPWGVRYGYRGFGRARRWW